MNALKWSLGLVCLSFSLMTASAVAETPYKITFKTSINGLPVTTTQTLIQSDTQEFELKTHSKNLFATLIEKSIFKLEDDRIYPLEHHFERHILGSDREEETHFDWNEKSASWSGKGQVKSQEITAGVFDRQTYQLQIREDLRNGLEEMDYTLFDRGKVKIYRFKTDGIEEIKTGIGSISAIKVKRIPDKTSDPETHLWFAPSLDYQIVKITHSEDDGAHYEMTLEHL